MMRFRFVVVGMTVAASAVGASSAQAQQLNLLKVMGAMGTIVNTGGNVAGAIVGVGMSTIMQQLSEQERQNRGISRHKAATSSVSLWRTTGQSGKTATDNTVGAVRIMGDQKCQKVQEKITFSSGEQGISEENVCFN